MIVWIASYPKSGNTLLRSILSSYFYSREGTFKFNNLYKITQFPSAQDFLKLGVNIDNEEEVYKNFIKVQNTINDIDKNVKFLKTHSSLCKMYGSNFTDLQNTLGVIYIVRDPRNVVTSLAHHDDLNIDQATDALCDEKRLILKTNTNCSTFLGSWSFNFNSWKALDSKKKYLLVKYEDLVNKKKSTVIKIFKFLENIGMKFDFDIIKLNKAIKSTDFEKMKSLEKKETFYEAVTDLKTGKRKVFFNLGPNNDWRRILDDKNREKIEKHFEKEMIELGYLRL